jgi:hypothetical protein
MIIMVNGIVPSPIATVIYSVFSGKQVFQPVKKQDYESKL